MAVQMDVLVVGAGPVGLFCANELHRHGLRCRIVDKKSELSDKSKALAIHIRSLDVMEDCGFIDEILSQGSQILGAIVKSQGEILADVTFAHVEASRHFLIDLPQDKTERILNQGLVNKGLRVEWQTELLSVEQSHDGVTALLKHHDGNTEKFNVSWVIACDGSHSTLRELVGAQFTGESYKQTWWLADLLIDWSLPKNKMVMYISEQGPVACFPIGESRYRLVMTAEEKISYVEPTIADIQRVFTVRTGEKATLSDPIWITQFGIAHRQIDNYRYNRIFFAGDAAHVHSPMGGQGLNTGMQDIYNLVWKLALVEKFSAPTTLLDSYHLERHPIGEQVLKKTDVMTKMILIRHPLLIALRNKFFRFLTSFDFVKKYITTDLAELNISYAKSPIVKCLGKKTVFKIGEFSANFPLTDGETKAIKQLHEITRGTMHHLFLFAGKDNVSLPNTLKTAITMNERFNTLMKTHLVLTNGSELPKFTSIFLEPDATIHRQFAINEPTALLIRPDKYVGLTQCPIEEKELISYMEHVYSK
ncbi:FAD dependent oxidoreductase [Legionella lansingensis]|uniref:FAD dependent oxidoreductase n=1 Tax=Legionella lansingensis TaxID=45067 RepID=A0A0W0VEQ2_9GAMM|nr:FAD-dependent monooxygenase [Legionella lansingensis]KTD18620.1 FAD dependent oxidoreductase [Legionella lansingensis]SNV46192.1 FAD dependent oxidoreductase [Legionella lansingensis]